MEVTSITGACEGRLRTRVFVHLDYGRSEARWLERFRRGEVWDSTPYGYGDAREFYDLSFSEDAKESAATRGLRILVRKILGFDLMHAIRNFRFACRCDVIWTHTESEHLAMSLLLSFMPRSRRPYLIAQSVWLWDEWINFGPVRKSAFRLLLKVPALHTTHSRVNRDIARSIVGQPVVLVPYGASGPPLSSLKPLSINEVRVLAPGNDRDRDWKPLVEAATRDSTLRVTIATKVPPRIPLPKNVHVEHVTSVKRMAELYSISDVVAIPLRENAHASGATVMIEAYSSGTPVVVSDTGGLRDLFPVGEFVTGDERWELALHLAVESDASQGPTIVQQMGYTASDFADRHVLLTEWLLGRCERGLEEASSLKRPFLRNS